MSSSQQKTPEPSPTQGWERTTRGLLCKQYYFGIAMSMDGIYSEDLLSSISADRLYTYKEEISFEDEAECYARYFWNTALGESLYPLLQALEITLRNRINTAIANERNTDDWFSEVLAEQDWDALETIRERLTAHKLPQTAGQVIANSDFGFWVRLLNARYENILWPGLLRTAFPHMPNYMRTRRTVLNRMNRIRALRNRVFHYEPIWNDHSLSQKHGEIKEAIGWLSPSMLKAAEMFDRFPSVFGLGSAHYKEVLLGQFRSGS